MALVEFVNDSAPYLNAQNLNNNFNECIPQVIYTGKLYGGQSTTLSGVKKKLIVYARTNTKDSIVYTIDFDTSISNQKTYGCGIVIAYDEASGSDYYLSESSIDTNNLFTHERTGYVKVTTGAYTNRNYGQSSYAQYYVYRIETID